MNMKHENVKITFLIYIRIQLSVTLLFTYRMLFEGINIVISIIIPRKQSWLEIRLCIDDEKNQEKWTVVNRPRNLF